MTYLVVLTVAVVCNVILTVLYIRGYLKSIIMNHDSTIDQPETITISKQEYQSLLEDARWLRCLKDAGVDNWPGCDFAAELLQQDENE